MTTEESAKKGKSATKIGNGELQEIDNRTIIKWKEGDDIRQTELMPAIIDVKHAIVDNKGKRWIVSVRPKNGEFVPAAEINSEILEHPAQLNAWLLEHGVCVNFDKPDRWRFKQLMYSKPGFHRVLHRLECGGLHHESGVILGHGWAIGCDGTLVKQAEDGSYFVKAKDQSGEVVERLVAPPTLGGIHYPVLGDCENPMSLAEARMMLADCVGAWRANLNHEGAAIAMGWAVACLYYREVHEQYRAFPHAYLYGRTKSGKNELAYWIKDMAGMEMCRPTAASSNIKHIRNKLHETGAFPLWVNELNDDKNQDLLDLIKDSFDGVGKGIAGREGGTREKDPRRGLLLSGEYLFGSDSQHNRYIGIYLRERTRNDAGWPAVEALKPGARRAFASLVLRRNDLRDEFLGALATYREELAKRGVDTRQAFAWAVALAGLKIATCSENPMRAFTENFWTAAMKVESDFRKLRSMSSYLRTIWDAAQTAYAAGRYGHSPKSQWFRLIVVLPEPNTNQNAKRYIGIWTKMMLRGIHGDRLSPPEIAAMTTMFTSHLREERWFSGLTNSMSICAGGMKERLHMIELIDDGAPENYPSWLVHVITNNNSMMDLAGRPEEKITHGEVAREG